jgi:integrase
MAEVIARRRNNKWEYRFEAARINGKRNQVSKSGFKTKKDALDAGVKALAEYNASGIHFTPSEISVSDYLDFWMEEYCKVNLKKTTIENYQKRIRLHIKPALGIYKLNSLSPITIQNFLNRMFNDGYSRNTLTTIRRILSGSLNYAVDTVEFIQTNPMRKVKIPSDRAVPDVPTRKAPHVYIPPDKIKEIFDRFPEGTSSFIPMQFGYRCGMRLGEAFGVYWEDIDLDNRTLSINRQVQWDNDGKFWYFSNPKYNSFRTIELDSELCDILLKEKEKQNRARVFYDNMYVNLFESEKRVLNSDGEGVIIHPVAVRECGAFIIPRTMQHASGIIHHDLGYEDFTFHSFRHTHATMLAESGAPMKYTQERLGHKDITVTMQIYQHASPTIRQEGLGVVEKMFSQDRDCENE